MGLTSGPLLQLDRLLHLADKAILSEVHQTLDREGLPTERLEAALGRADLLAVLAVNARRIVTPEVIDAGLVELEELAHVLLV